MSQASHQIDRYFAVIPQIQNVYGPEEEDGTGLWRFGFKYQSGVFEFFAYKTEAEADAGCHRLLDAIDRFYGNVVLSDVVEAPDNESQLRHAAEQASLVLFAAKGPREAFRAKQLLDKALDGTTVERERLIAAAVRCVETLAMGGYSLLILPTESACSRLDELRDALVDLGEIPDENPEDKKGGAVTPPERNQT